jgi:DNA-directed RNA polymerase subunit RPC12/RpoP
VKNKPNILLQIFERSWDAFKQKFPSYSTSYYDSVIEKVIGCGDPQFGYLEYRCLDCGQSSHLVGFSCKTKFCLRCGRIFAEDFVTEVMGKLHPGVVYRHLILTIPEQLRSLFYQNRHKPDLFNLFFQSGWNCVQSVIKVSTKKQLQCGCLMVVHVVGRKSDYKPHLHILVMDGGVDHHSGQWVGLGYFPYKILHKKWQYHLLEMVKKFSKAPSICKLVNELWEKYPNGFVGQILKGTVPKKSQKLAKYLAKYLFRPSISLRRIKSYDAKEGTVTYEYQSHKSKKTEVEKVDVMTFVGRMVQQILPKGFQRIRYYGLQASRSYKKSKDLIMAAMKKVIIINEEEGVIRATGKPKYFDRLREWGQEDLLRCKHCGSRMTLVKVWIESKGVVFDLLSVLSRKAKPPPKIIVSTG